MLHPVCRCSLISKHDCCWWWWWWCGTAWRRCYSSWASSAQQRGLMLNDKVSILTEYRRIS